MNQRYDLVAISFLMLTAVLSVFMALGPKEFALKDWQPLMASFVALGAATLAYRAAMAKVDFDRDAAQRADKRAALRLCLRLEYTVKVIKHEAALLIRRVPADVSKGIKVKISDLTVGPPNALDEAWASLETFPRSMSRNLARLRGSLYDRDVLASLFKSEMVWDLSQAHELPLPLQKFRDIAGDIGRAAEACIEDLDVHIAELSK